MEITVSIIFYRMKPTQACAQAEHMMWLHVSKHSSSTASPFKHPGPDCGFGLGLREQCAAPLDGDRSLGPAPGKQGGEPKNPHGEKPP